MSQFSTLVLYDIDGTLLWSRGCGRVAMEATLLEMFGHTGGLNGLQFGGKTDWQILIEALGMAEQEIAEHLRIFERTMRDHLMRLIGDYAVAACPGAAALVEATTAEPTILTGLLTGNLSLTAPVKLQAAGFDPALFRVGAYGSDAPWRHMLPALAMERARELAGVAFAGKRIAIIGDTPNDVACGRDVGAKSIAVLTGAGERAALEAARPDYLFEDLDDTAAVMSAILA